MYYPGAGPIGFGSLFGGRPMMGFGPQAMMMGPMQNPMFGRDGAEFSPEAGEYGGNNNPQMNQTMQLLELGIILGLLMRMMGSQGQGQSPFGQGGSPFGMPGSFPGSGGGYRSPGGGSGSPGNGGACGPSSPSGPVGGGDPDSSAGPINNPTDFARALLQKLGCPQTPANIQSIVKWEGREGGQWHNSAHFNPLNTTLNAPGATSMNGCGVKAYQSWDQGLQATADTLSHGYPDLVRALQSGGGLANGSYAGLSKWSGGGYSSI